MSHSNLDILLLFDSSLYTKYLSLIKKQDFLQKPPGSSWRAIPAYPHAPKHSLQLLHTLTLAFYHFFIALYMQNTFQLPKNRISLKTLKEAVDELFQLNKKRFCINFLFFYIVLWSKLTWVKQELSRLSKISNAIWRPKCSLQSLRVIRGFGLMCKLLAKSNFALADPRVTEISIQRIWPLLPRPVSL